MKLHHLLFILIFLSLHCAAQEHTDTVFMFSYFKNNGEDGLHLAASKDGYHFKALNNDRTFLKPLLSKDSLMRDPCIIRDPHGRFHMVWTVSWNDRGIGYASSGDLLHWSEQLYIPVMQQEENVLNCWAPEITYDPATKEYFIYWATTIPGRFPATDKTGDENYNHRIYYCSTTDFKSFTRTAILWDPGFNTIDASIQVDDKKYIMFLKDETRHPVPQKKIYVAVSREIEKGYKKSATAITGNYWAEGPTAIKKGNKWIVYFDKYRDHVYGAVESNDLNTWQDISDKISFPEGTRHGTIFTISAAEFRQFFPTESL